MQVRF